MSRQAIFTKEQVFIDKLGISVDVRLKHEDDNKITSTFSFSGRKQCVKFGDWLYKDATIYLERKYQKYIEAKEYKPKNRWSDINVV